MRVEHIALTFLIAASIASADGNAAPQTDRQMVLDSSVIYQMNPLGT
jgi:hypothetical protein